MSKKENVKERSETIIQINQRILTYLKHSSLKIYKGMYQVPMSEGSVPLKNCNYLFTNLLKDSNQSEVWYNLTDVSLGS